MARAPRRALCLRATESAGGRLPAPDAREAAVRKVPRQEIHLDDSIRGSFETMQVIDRAMAELEGEPSGVENDKADSGQEDT